MKCLHCRVAFHDNPETIRIIRDKSGFWNLIYLICSNCNNAIFYLRVKHTENKKIDNKIYPTEIVKDILVYPKGSSRPPYPPEVPQHIAKDYNEACLILYDSPNASAALSRRCLQNVLYEKTDVKHSNLHNELNEVLASKILPGYLAESLDVIRNLGNIGTHPIKSEITGQILPVEPHEAEWTLDILEALFDFYWVQPASLQKKKERLNKKLAEAGRPPVK